MHDQSCPALFLVPLEAGKIRQVEFIVRLVVQSVSSFSNERWQKKGKEEDNKEETDLLLELLVDGIHRILDRDAFWVSSRHFQP